MLTVQVWSDIACPFCYIGKLNLQKAVLQAGLKELKIIYRSFELDPDTSSDSVLTIYDDLMERYQISLQEVKGMVSGVIKKAIEAGIKMNFDKLIPTNTFDGHRLVHFAASKGIAGEVYERLFKAFFTDSLNIGKKEVLLKIAKSAGLDELEVAEVLGSDIYSKEVRQDEIDAENLGIDTVPHFLINDKISISGALSVDELKNALLKAL